MMLYAGSGGDNIILSTVERADPEPEAVNRSKLLECKVVHRLYSNISQKDRKQTHMHTHRETPGTKSLEASAGPLDRAAEKGSHRYIHAISAGPRLEFPKAVPGERETLTAAERCRIAGFKVQSLVASCIRISFF